MKNLKFKVHSPEHSEAIQKRLFELGIEKPSEGKKEWLLLHSGGISGYWDQVPEDCEHYQLATLDDLYNPEFIKDEREELLEEAKRRYPAGTRFIYEDNTYTSTDEFWSSVMGLHVIPPENEWDQSESSCSDPFVYKDGQWAEIVQENNEEKYPTIGKIAQENRIQELEDLFNQFKEQFTSRINELK